MFLVFAAGAEDKPLTNGEPKSPEEEKKTFQLAPGFRIDLVACEPQVVDPVAMCFDEKGDIYVCEMIGYPNGGVATGMESRGRIKKLSDKNGDGFYETAEVFADGLRFPTGITPWKGGFIVCNAPDIIYLKDTKGTGKADLRKVLYTGFDLKNIQQLPNHPQLYVDGYIHVMVGLNGGTLTCPEKPEMPPLTLCGRGIRFDPDVPGKIEPISGGGQYGLTHDGLGHWFTNTNAQHLRQIVIPDHYLRRNPDLAVTAVTVDIPEHGPAAKVFRISPFEAWRLERTTRRKDDPTTAKRLPSTELVPGGYFTSACSPLVTQSIQFDSGTVLVCDPANNLVHREKLMPTTGPLFKAVRIDEGKEFLAATDNWFRPCFLAHGPDDAVYVCDFYREAIETPLSLPEDLKKRMNLESRQRGRIWRIEKSDSNAGKFDPLPSFVNDKWLELLLGNKTEVPKENVLPATWKAATVTRLCLERNMVDRLEPFAIKNQIFPGSREFLNYAGLRSAKGLLATRDVIDGFFDEAESEIRDSVAIPMLQLSESRIAAGSFMAVQTARKRLSAASPRIRFQAILSLGADPNLKLSEKDLQVLKKDLGDPWFASAVLTTFREIPFESLRMFVESEEVPPPFLRQLGALYAVKYKEVLLEAPLYLFEHATSNPRAAAALDGLAAGLRTAGGSLDAFWERNPAAKEKLEGLFARHQADALDGKLPPDRRVQSIRLLELRPAEQRLKIAAALLQPSQPAEVQAAMIGALAASTDKRVTAVLLAAWPNATPGVRTVLQEALLARPERITALLDAVEAKAVEPRELGSLAIEAIRNHRTPAIKQRAAKLLATAVNADRQKIIEDYKAALELKPDRERGKAVFAKNCSVCHMLDKVGNDVGANLTAALPNKTRDALLIDILDPSREVDSRYVNYTVNTQSGRTVSGILALETPTSVTLRRAEKAEDTILRKDIEAIAASKKSLMPEDMEKQLSKQDLADLLEYLLKVGK